jgi:broad specificity phosphatase PhoE
VKAIVGLPHNEVLAVLLRNQAEAVASLRAELETVKAVRLQRLQDTLEAILARLGEEPEVAARLTPHE